MEVFLPKLYLKILSFQVLLYNIVKSHGGFIGVESEVEVGTAFHIFLPVAAEDEGFRGEDDATQVRDGAGELVLVVDDEAFIRETARQTLEEAGYRVLTASGGQEGLAVLADHPNEVAAVVTDLLMPEMSGVETIGALRRQHPGLPIIAISGLIDGTAQDALDAGAQLFLAKPFTAETLCAALAELLRRGVERG